MRRITHDTWAGVLGVVYLGLMGNVLLCAGSLPLVILIITTDPAASWPWIAVSAVLAAPSPAALFRVFRNSGGGSTEVVRPFIRAWRRVCLRAWIVGIAVVGLLVVLLVDVRMLADTPFSVVTVPVLLVLTVLTLGAGLLALVAVAEEPAARLPTVLRAAMVLTVRHWPFSLVSLAVLAVQGVLLANVPALALGLTAAPALYVAWANSRYSWRRVLSASETPS